MVLGTLQSPSSPPPQRSHFSTPGHITSRHNPPFQNTSNPELSLKNLSFTKFLFLPTFTFPHNSGTQRQVSSFRGCNPIPWRNNHLRRLIIARHTSPTMLVTLWNKGQCGVNSRWCSCHRLSFLKISISIVWSFFCGIHLSSSAHFMITTSYSI